MGTTERLIRLGLVRQVDHPTHRPGKALRLTDKGRDILRSLSPEEYEAAPVPTREQFREARERAIADLRERR